MTCECGYAGNLVRAIVLTIRVPADVDGNVILSDFRQKDIPYGSVKVWIQKEAESQCVEVLECPRCGKDYSK